MNARFRNCRLTGLYLAAIVLTSFALIVRAADRPPKMYQPTNGEFSVLGDALIKLLQTRDAAGFATNMAADFEDYRSIAATNTVEGRELLKGFKNATASQRWALKSSATALLDRAKALHLDFSSGQWHASIISPKYTGSINFGALRAKGEGLPWLPRLEMNLIPGNGGGSSTNGYFKIAIRNLIKFPGGWRCTGGVQWESFPANVADAETLRQIAILDKVANYKRITEQDDPALLRLGQDLIEVLKSQDVSLYQKKTLVNADLVWKQLRRSGQNGGPSREEFNREMNNQIRKQMEIARSTLKQMDAAGIDLKGATIQIKDATIEHCQSQGIPGSLDGLMGEDFKLTFAVKSEGKSATGASLSGDYILAADEIMRIGNDWRIEDGLRWYQFPAGVVDTAIEKKLKFENYVAEHRALPPGMAAPEIRFITLDGETAMKLSSLRGRIVVLDFWATWCGPCQQPMADLQRIREGHPDWGDKVAIVPLSIDDTIETVQKHVDARGWTNTFNAWAGNGGWNSAPAKAFRITAVPTTYIIDAKGKIVTAGHPAALPIAETVDRLIKK